MSHDRSVASAYAPFVRRIHMHIVISCFSRMSQSDSALLQRAPIFEGLDFASGGPYTSQIAAPHCYPEGEVPASTQYRS